MCFEELVSLVRHIPQQNHLIFSFVENSAENFFPSSITLILHALAEIFLKEMVISDALGQNIYLIIIAKCWFHLELHFFALSCEDWAE